jgi:hypothetical protein
VLETSLTIVYMLIITAMGATSYLQKTNERMVVAFIFTFVVLGFDFISHMVDIPPFFYYIAAGILDLMVILIISNLNKLCRLSDDILLISLISIAYNFAGFVMFNAGQEDLVYRAMYLILYGWALFVLMRGEPENDGNAKGGTWLYSLRVNADTRHYINHTN